MPTYITQGRFTQKGIKGLIDKPEDRRAAAEAMMSAAGFRLKDYYATLGEYDFLVITEGPDELPSSLLAVAASGAIADLKTCVAYSTIDLKTAAEKAGAILRDYKAPGG